ncbi:DUF6538 domain-containing protein [Breoghania sp.]|uniref:DUF6538 domain-containing protein n=1 Tax=Breoghania sp. TaxID=2065378 RepID=UPI0026086697|nr:DUF6538 domain-containing protein [Breoghania sp.]MDJ0933538.1 hypothetical protein [Breoghania sp.]
MKGRKISLPIGGKLAQVTINQLVKVSLRTKDVSEAKERHRKASAALDDVWEAIRSGPKPLSFKQIQALAGEFYRL